MSQMSSRESVYCRNPDPVKQGTNIPRWKFDLIRGAIVDILEKHPEGVEFKGLPQLVRSRVPDEIMGRLGSVAWYTTVVKLHLETVCEIERVPGSRPQVVRSRARDRTE